MCWKLPSTAMFSRLAFASCQVATRFTTIPPSATTITSPALDVRRRDEPADRLVDDQPGEDEQDRAVRLRGEDLGPPEPVGHASGRRPRGEPEREQREADRAGVGEHVRRVGEEGERVRQDARRHLGHHEAEDQPERDPEAPPVRVGRDRMRVVVRLHALSKAGTLDLPGVAARSTSDGPSRLRSRLCVAARGPAGVRAGQHGRRARHGRPRVAARGGRARDRTRSPPRRDAGEAAEHRGGRPCRRGRSLRARSDPARPCPSEMSANRLAARARRRCAAPSRPVRQTAVTRPPAAHGPRLAGLDSY